MQESYKDIFNEHAGDAEIFKTSPNVAAINKVGLAGDNLSSVNTPYKTASARNIENKKKGDDIAASVSQQMLLAQQQFSEAMESARESIAEFENILESAQVELDAKKDELDESTITLADGSKAYLNTDNNQFMQQDKNGNWHDLDNEQQAEAHARWQANGVTATQQDKIMLDAQQARINTNSNKMETSKAELDDIQQSVDSGIMTTSEGADAAQKVEGNLEYLKDETGYSFTINPAVTASHEKQVSNNELDSLFDTPQSNSVLSDSTDLFEAGDLNKDFSTAASNTQIEVNKPTPDNTAELAHTASSSPSP